MKSLESYLSIFNKHNSPKAVALLVGAFSFIGVGCASEDSVRRDHNLSPVERIDFEFGGQMIEGEGGDCLAETPYDPKKGRNPAAPLPSEGPNGELYITLTPAREVYGEDVDSVTLTGFDDSSRNLQPADEASGAILDAYGC